MRAILCWILGHRLIYNKPYYTERMCGCCGMKESLGWKDKGEWTKGRRNPYDHPSV